LSDRHSTIGQEGLNALLLLFFHQDILVDVDEVVDVFVKKIESGCGFRTPAR